MAHEISSSDSQVDNVQMFKVNIIYYSYAHIGIKLQGVGMEADKGISSIVFCVSTVEGYENHIKWLNWTYILGSSDGVLITNVNSPTSARSLL